jgi:uncharacterized protein
MNRMMNGPATGRPTSTEAQSFSVPARYNPRLQTLVERINADEELRQLWRSANLNAAERLGLGDHGETHARIVANAALKLLRLLREAGHTPSVVTRYHLSPEDAEVIIVLAAALHDLGLAIHPDAPARFGLELATRKAHELLADVYSARQSALILSETLHAIVAHTGEFECLTLEAGVLTLANALDMAKGRLSTPGQAALIEEVTLRKGEQRPVRVVIRLRQGQNTPPPQLQQKLRHSTLEPLVEVLTQTEGEAAIRFASPSVLEVR